MERNKTKKKRWKLALLLVDLIAVVMLLRIFHISDETMKTIAWAFSSAWAAVRATHWILKTIVFYAKNRDQIKELRRKWKRDLKEE